MSVAAPRLYVSASHRTRVKICGIADPDDARCAVQAGVDALGLIFYAGSPRNVSLAKARSILAEIPPFVTRVALFVNASDEWIQAVLRDLEFDLLQFHGDETESQCLAYGKPWLKALHLRPDRDVAAQARQFPLARGLVLDSHDACYYGGTGRRFDWNLVPATMNHPLILAGGLDVENVQDAIRQVRPWAVDVSSGVESAPGRKDAARMRAFIAAVRHAE